jgi:hypothetical protein
MILETTTLTYQQIEALSDGDLARFLSATEEMLEALACLEQGELLAEDHQDRQTVLVETRRLYTALAVEHLCRVTTRFQRISEELLHKAKQPQAAPTGMHPRQQTLRTQKQAEPPEGMAFRAQRELQDGEQDVQAKQGWLSPEDRLRMLAHFYMQAAQLRGIDVGTLMLLDEPTEQQPEAEPGQGAPQA